MKTESVAAARWLPAATSLDRLDSAQRDSPKSPSRPRSSLGTKRVPFLVEGD